MKKRFIIFMLLGSIVSGAMASWVVSSIGNHNLQSSSSASSSTESPKDFHFASALSDVTLPDLTSAAEKGVMAVVNIENVHKVQVPQFGGNDMFEFFFGPGAGRGQQPQSGPQTREQRSGGSGVIISDDGYIVTNNHVIDGADELKVTLHDGQQYKAKLVGTDPSTDIALVKIEATGLPTLTFGNSEDLRLGQWLLAVGNPMGLNSTVTAGIVSATGRSLGMLPTEMGIESFIQTDAVVNPGNSGGALMTVDGNLVGINTILKSNTGTYIGYSFAVPSSIVRKVVSDIREYGLVQRAVLGIRYSEISPEWLEQFSSQIQTKESSGL
ncbi:MAG: trypsin-like peptidase domain-containing protein, partial [Mucinivorans sp.]